MPLDGDPPRPPGNDAGPLVRPYVVTGGRAAAPRGRLDAAAQVVSTGVDAQGGDDRRALGPEHREILRLCREPRSVAEIAAAFGRSVLPAERRPFHDGTDGDGHGLPLGVIRVLLGDLLDEGRVTVEQPTDPKVADLNLYREILVGLRAL
ncbi:DUF742 domain-containing protein [Thermomonospora umbrina]|uniref:Uncharacterized protein DUF742 n=1 Tax=Thermomonospora umbrina TaxID=111806 RepID=A0A3D9SP89_9ACTN|nr:DUF742 domain-containing protein [Thermomonospora umbrina]REE97437.1 uncharacterized protein DUF742 [Thermomonospora umbrina]